MVKMGALSALVLGVVAAVSACSDDGPPAVAPQDSGTADVGVDAGAPPLTNPSLHNTVLGRPTDTSLFLRVQNRSPPRRCRSMASARIACTSGWSE